MSYQAIHRVRKIAQAAAFLGFLYLFLRTALRHSATVERFLRFDPLVVLGTGLATWGVARTALWSLVLVALTVLVGRFFCGWICPMGTALDLGQRVLPPKTRQNQPSHRRLEGLKYYLLCFILAGSLLGVTAGLAFDPLVLLTRTLTLSFFPPTIWLANRLLQLTRPLASHLGLLGLTQKVYPQPVMTMGLVSLVLFAGIVALGRIEKRAWCRYLCPLGALLSLGSVLGRVRRQVTDACNDCARCARNCPMGAIHGDFRTTTTRECILCQQCAAICPQGAIRFGAGAPRAQIDRSWGTSRRAFMYAAAGSVGVAAMAQAAPGKLRSARLIRPPGSIPEGDFVNRCVRCGACMKACPTGGLQPTFLQAGLEGLWTAYLVPRLGACEAYCNQCGQVCPTAAIRNLTLEEKQYATMGTAVISRGKCLAWEQLKLCLVCDEVCPYGAIDFRMVTDATGTLERPFVNEEKCTGCGLCEHHCPVDGRAAICVERFGEERKASGSYITPAKRRLRALQDDRDTDYFREHLEDSAGPNSPQDAEGGDRGLPPGFLED